MTNFPTLLYIVYLNLQNPYPFIYLKPEKATPYGRSLLIKPIRGSTPREQSTQHVYSFSLSSAVHRLQYILSGCSFKDYMYASHKWFSRVMQSNIFHDNVSEPHFLLQG